MRTPARALVTIGLAAATLVAAQRVRVTRSAPYDIELVPRADVVRIASFGHPTSAANVYWLKAVQYIGEPRANERGWKQLFPALDLVTSLDPGHGYAYQVGGTILGSVGRVAESNALLEKGMRNVPDRYILPFLRAFNAFYYEGDFALAGRYIEIAARTPNAPPHLRDMVLAFYVKGGEADAAISFLEHVRAEARDPETAKAVESQLRQATLERDAAALDSAIEKYRATHGVFPPTLEVLVAGGLIPEIPRDPFGGVYVIGPDGRVRSSANVFRFKRGEDVDRRVEPGVKPPINPPAATPR